MTLSRYQIQHIDLISEIEQNPAGRVHWNGRVATALFRENTRSINTLTNLLENRVFSKREDVRFWEKRNASRPAEPLTPYLPVEHGAECPCDGCTEAVLHMAWDIIGLPRKAGMGGRLT